MLILQGLTAVVEASSGLSTVQREHLRTIASSGEDLLGLINNILDHSRLESDSVTLENIPFSLRDVTEAALDTIASMAQNKDIEIFLISPITEDPPRLMGDPFRTKQASCILSHWAGIRFRLPLTVSSQVLLNLLSNAVKFTAKGRVTARCNYERLPHDEIRITLQIEDTGIGIPASSKAILSFTRL